jgi:hypothetical protein
MHQKWQSCLILGQILTEEFNIQEVSLYEMQLLPEDNAI